MDLTSGDGSRPSLIVAERTQECLRLIKDRARNGPAEVILLLGRTGVGKSSLLEHLTGAVGHSQEANDPVTTEFQIEENTIDGKQYFFMDTPGFDAGTELEAFRKIADGIEAVRGHARIVGVLYVTKINHSRVEKIDRKLLEFIQSFCGDEYIPRITFVTTHWNASHNRERQRHNQKLDQLRQLWGSYLAEGAKLYQHGREYNEHGEDTGAFLSWYSDRLQIAEYGKDMISRHYGDTDSPAPRIVQELDANIPLRLTSAATCLGLAQESASVPPGETPKEQSEQESSRDSSSVQDEASQRVEEPSRTTPPESNQEVTGRSWFQTSVDFVTAVLQNRDFNRTRSWDGPFTGGSARPAGFRSGGPVRNVPSDPNSVVDFMKSRGLDSSFTGRQHLAAELGINAGPPGSARQNIALHNALRGQR